MPEKLTVVVLPGLNGTAALLQSFLSLSPAGWQTCVIEYPLNEKKSYAELLDYVESELRSIDGPKLLLGESFSGPIAVFLSSKSIPELVGTVLVASFVTPPSTKLARFLPWELGFCLVRPLYWMRRYVAKQESAAVIRATSEELQRCSAAVLADRIRSIFSVDARSALAQSKVPMAYFLATQDVIVNRHNLKIIQKIKPDIAVFECESPHFLLQYVPQKAWRAINEFVSTRC